MKNCPNCNTVVSKTFKYCPECGQEAKLDQKVGSLITHFLNDYFTFDSKIIRSIVPLITKPAFLTQEYMKGRRVKYIQPLRLFIFLSVIFFLVLSWTNSTEVDKAAIDELNEAFWNRFFENWLPKLFFILLPIFALILAFLYRKQKKGLMPHFLFALHFHASLFLMGILYALLSFTFLKMGWQKLNVMVFLLIGIYLAFYLWRSLRRMYNETRLKTSWKFVLLALLYLLLLISSTMILIVVLSL